MKSLLFALIFFYTIAIDSCPTPSVSIGDDECLVPVGTDNFYEAQMDCINMGGYLPSVLSNEDNLAIQKLSEERALCSAMWLGMDDRRYWTDGNQYLYENWEHGYLTTQSSGCAAMDKASGSWKIFTCELKLSYFCRVSLETAHSIFPNQGIDRCQHTSDEPLPFFKTTCPTTSLCHEKYNIVSLVAVQNDQNYKYALQFLDKLTTNCDNKDFGYLLLPNAEAKCSSTKMDKNFWQKAGKGFNSSSINITGDDFVGMMQKAIDCNILEDRTKAGSTYLMTDLSCQDLCTDDFQTVANSFVDTTMSRNSTFHIFQLNFGDSQNSQGECFLKMFNRCGQYSDSMCKAAALNVSNDDWNSDARKDNINNMYTCDNPRFPVGLVVALVIVSVISLIGLIGIFFLRWRLKKAGGWKKFWSSEAGRENKEDVQADVWELEKGQLTVFEDKQLGSGAFAVVYEGQLTGNRPIDVIHPASNISTDVSGRVAVKRVPPHADWFAKKEFLDEIRFMKELGSHSHILGMIGCVTRADLPLIVLELCELGDLLAYVRTKKDEFSLEEGGSFRMKDMISIAWQVSDGLTYLKMRNIIHRDLASRNVLLTNSLVAKISDFGLCREANSSVYISKGGRLPIKHMAIESLKTNSFSHQSDIWSFGILLWEMFSFGDAPFPSVQPADFLDLLLSGERLSRPEICPPKVFRIMEDCWLENPEQRRNIEAIRSEFSSLLHESSLYYGYVTLPSLADLDEDKNDSISNERQRSVTGVVIHTSNSQELIRSREFSIEDCEQIEQDFFSIFSFDSLFFDENE